MSIRTDLAVEKMPSNATAYPGIFLNKRDGSGCDITEIVIESDEAGAQIGKGKGRYITIETHNLSEHPEEFDEMTESIAKEISALSPPDGEVLIIGLGNNDITPDALGPQTINKVVATRHLNSELPKDNELSSLRPVSAIAPGVLGQTGIEVAEITKAICDKINPSVVVVIDALACSDINRLGTTIQISDTGISPGSGVNNSRKELSHKTLGVPVIAIGVPTVVDMHTIAENITGKEVAADMPNMMVTPRDVDKLIERTAKLVAFSLNRCFVPYFSLEELNAMS